MNVSYILRYRSLFFIAFLIPLFFVSCAELKKEPLVSKKSALKKVWSFWYPKFSDDMAYEGLENSILKSISYLKKVPSNRMFTFEKDSYSAAHMIKSLERFLSFIQTTPSDQDMKKYIKSNYFVYKSVGGNTSRKVLFTGYYEPIIEASLEKTFEYRFPIYSRPYDLITIDLSLFSEKYKGKRIIGRYAEQTVFPYYERNEIENQGVLDGNAEEIAWVKDPVDLFFLQIQGSGKICLEDGNLINIHYHIANGRPYRSIGKLLIDEGKIPKSEMSMQKIRSYLSNHPDEVEAILNYNPSYVFFKIEEEGPLGYLGVKLTPGRSIALDRRIFPLAALAFIETEKPAINDGQIDNWTDFSRFVLNQDTGGAIRGPGRADLFWGNGPYAEIAAGHMQHMGKLYFLILKPDA